MNKFLKIEIATVCAKSRAKNKIMRLVYAQPHRKCEFLKLQHEVFEIFNNTRDEMIEKLMRNEAALIAEIQISNADLIMTEL